MKNKINKLFDEKFYHSESCCDLRYEEKKKLEKVNCYCEHKEHLNFIHNQIIPMVLEDIAEKLVKIEKERWDDAVHCTCLAFAIVDVFGEEYEERVKKYGL